MIEQDVLKLGRPCRIEQLRHQFTRQFVEGSIGRGEDRKSFRWIVESLGETGSVDCSNESAKVMITLRLVVDRGDLDIPAALAVCPKET